MGVSWAVNHPGLSPDSSPSKKKKLVNAKRKGGKKIFFLNNKNLMLPPGGHTVVNFMKCLITGNIVLDIYFFFTSKIPFYTDH